MFDMLPVECEVLIIGAGPSGAAMASWLADRGIQSVVIEKQQFPRFTIGESLLPEAINCLDEAGLLDAVEAGNYQYKDGALFTTNHQRQSFDFSDGFTPGRGYAYQVPRADFDLRLMNCCERKGVQVCYNTAVSDIAPVADGYQLTLESNAQQKTIKAQFLVDASGFARVLAKAFGLEKPSSFASKTALFSHIKADLMSDTFDRNKIMIAQTQLDQSCWYWLIPFESGLCSVGVVSDIIVPCSQIELQALYQQRLSEQVVMSNLVGGKTLTRDVGCISGYSASVSTLHGDRYVLLGNAGEFIDPIFSSGVTIALKSALFAGPLVLEVIKDRVQPDWEHRFQRPLLKGVDTFKEYVAAWYSGVLPQLFFSPNRTEHAYRMICSILAGYVWDQSNPFTRMTQSRLQTLLTLSK